MTKIWDTTKYDNFHSGIKKYTKNTIKDLKKVSKKQQEFSTNNKGTKSKTFDGAKAYMGEVHPSIVTSINRALDEYMRVVDKLESDFEDSVDSAGNVKIDTDMINQLNKDTDRKVEDVYQAHAELQKQIDICNTDSNTMPIVAPLFGPLETNMNTINTHLIKVKDSMDDYDMSHNNALNAYHQLVEATRKAIDAAKTNYTAPNGAINYSSGAFANSPEGEALSNANYQLEAAKLAELYEADNGNLDNMVDYANELLQDPARLEQEMAYLKYLIENRAFSDKEKERSQLTTFYYLLIQLKAKKSKASGVTNGENFQVNRIEVVKNDRFNTELNVSCQFMSAAEFESYYATYVNPSTGTKEVDRNRYLNNTFTLKHFGLDVEDMVYKDKSEMMKEQMKTNDNNWIIPMATFAAGYASPVAGAVTGVVGLVGELGSIYSEDKRNQEKINKKDLVNTADKFDMTCTITTNTTGINDTTDIAITPTEKSQAILDRWEEVANRYEQEGNDKENQYSVEFPKNKDYLQLMEYYRNNKDQWSEKDREYIFEGK